MVARSPEGTAAPAPITVCAVVVNWRQPELTSAAVTSLEQQTDLEGIALSVVIVDNGSGDDSAARLAARHPQHRVVARGTNGGFGAGVNAGIRAVAADVYLLLNNDAVADPGFVAGIVAPLRADRGVGAVTAQIVLQGRYRRADPGEGGDVLVAADGSRWLADADGVELLNSTGNETTRSGNGRDRDWLAPVTTAGGGAPRPAGEVLGFSGGAAALRTEALIRAGLFDESLFMYYEDTDLSWRLRRAGWSIRYEPSAVVRHAHAASAGTGSEVFRFHNERNRILVAAKNAPAGVVLTAVARTSAATLRSQLTALRGRSAAARADARRRRRSLGAALRRLPAALAERRRLDHEAVVPRSRASAFLVRD